jgi:hypothetical protein
MIDEDEVDGISAEMPSAMIQRNLPTSQGTISGVQGLIL